jgi:flagellar biosynthesis/type III secretory pathway protein FliH
MSRYKLPLVEKKTTSVTKAAVFLHEGAVGHEPVAHENALRQSIPDETKRQHSLDVSSEIEELNHLKNRVKDLEAENNDLKDGLKQIEDDSRQAGYQQGLELAQEHFAEELESLSSLFDQIDLSLQNAMKSISEDIATVVIEANTRILGKQMLEKKLAIDVVLEVLRKAGYQEKMVVNVSPDDHELLSKHRLRLSSIKNIEFVSDEKVKLGGCIVKTDSGMIDGRLEVQLQALYDILHGVNSATRSSD